MLRQGGGGGGGTGMVLMQEGLLFFAVVFNLLGKLFARRSDIRSTHLVFTYIIEIRGTQSLLRLKLARC